MRLFGYLWFFVMLLGALDVLGQQLSFEYDVAGNQVQRVWACLDCPPVVGSSVVERDSLLLLRDWPVLGDWLLKEAVLNKGLVEADSSYVLAAGNFGLDALTATEVIGFQTGWLRSLFRCGRLYSGF